jgi:uncharacterized FlgJ-related protein
VDCESERWQQKKEKKRKEKMATKKEKKKRKDTKRIETFQDVASVFVVGPAAVVAPANHGMPTCNRGPML